jgi:nanoRNase/pAp phosphatase (c-di-AMP/oligoRNAs hydrolase)
MVTDSAGFSIANNAFLSDLTEVLVNARVDFQEVLSSIAVPVESSEKIAKLKGAQRLVFVREGGYIIATSHVSSFESSVAKALVHMGADAAFVGAAKEGEVRISGRAQRGLVGKGYHLGRDILPAIAPLIQGDAGGHAGAAGANGVDASKLEAAMALCVQRTREFIKSLNITSTHKDADDIVREGTP